MSLLLEEGFSLTTALLLLVLEKQYLRLSIHLAKLEVVQGLILDGFYFNQGPHALCINDANDSILKEIGISYTGKIAAGKGYPIKGGKKQEIRQ